MLDAFGDSYTDIIDEADLRQVGISKRWVYLAALSLGEMMEVRTASLVDQKYLIWAAKQGSVNRASRSQRRNLGSGKASTL